MNSNIQTDTQAIPPGIQSGSSNSIKMIATMGAIGFASALLIVFTYQFTLPYIKINKARILEKAVFKVIPGAVKKKVFIKDKDGRLVELKGEDKKAYRLYAGYDKNGKLAGVAIEAQGQGFQDVLQILYGYSPDCECVVGMKVLDSRETPGLGDKIETDPAFVANFKALDAKLDTDKNKMLNPIVLVKKGEKNKKWQVEAITGATISSRAIANILRKSTKKVIPVITRNLGTLRGTQK